jgi:hypothetical protein
MYSITVKYRTVQYTVHAYYSTVQYSASNCTADTVQYRAVQYAIAVHTDFINMMHDCHWKITHHF